MLTPGVTIRQGVRDERRAQLTVRAARTATVAASIPPITVDDTTCTGQQRDDTRHDRPPHSSIATLGIEPGISGLAVPAKRPTAVEVRVEQRDHESSSHREDGKDPQCKPAEPTDAHRRATPQIVSQPPDHHSDHDEREERDDDETDEHRSDPEPDDDNARPGGTSAGGGQLGLAHAIETSSSQSSLK